MQKKIDGDNLNIEYKCKYCGETHIYDESINNMYLQHYNYYFLRSTTKLDHANKCPNFDKVTTPRMQKWINKHIWD